MDVVMPNTVPLPGGRRWQQSQRRQRAQRQPVLAAFTLALLGHAGLLHWWWHEAPLPGITLHSLPSLQVRLYEAPAMREYEAPALREDTRPPPTATAQPPAPARTRSMAVSVDAPPVTAQLPSPAADATPAPGGLDPASLDADSRLLLAPEDAARGGPVGGPRPAADIGREALPLLPGADHRARPQALDTAPPPRRLPGAGLSSAPVTGGGLLNKLVAPSHFEHMVDSGLVDLQGECRPTADGRLYCPERTRAQVPGSVGRDD